MTDFQGKLVSWKHVEGIFSCLVPYFRTSTFTDLVLHTEDTSNPILAHSIVLAALSPNLKSILTTVVERSGEDSHHIVIPGVTRTQLEKALQSIYQGMPDEASFQCLVRSGMLLSNSKMLNLDLNAGLDIKKEDELETAVNEPLVGMPEIDFDNDIHFDASLDEDDNKDTISEDPDVFYKVKSKSFKCDLCSWAFTDNWKLQRHKERHSKTKPYKLKGDNVDNDKVEYRKLTKTKKKESKSKSNRSEKKKTTRKREKLWKKRQDCGCNLEFENKKAWLAHMKADHPDSVIFSCSLCQGVKFTYSRPETLEKHMQSRHSHKCSKCEYSCGSKDVLRRHERFKHPDSKNCLEFEREENEVSFCCDVCGKKVASSSSLYSHKLVHLERTWPCSQCGKKFRTQEASALHEIEAHSNEEFLCTICARSCASKRKLREHTRLVHLPDSEKPYQCSICSKGFLGKNSLQSHMSSIHYKDTPHACRYGCGRAYNDGSNRNQHERKAHGGLHHSVVEKLTKSGNRTYDPTIGKFINKRQRKCDQEETVKTMDSD